MSIRKSAFTDNTSGMWAGLVGNTMKLFLGTSSNFLKWDGTSLSIAGALNAGSININNKAIIDANGNATFIGITSLNVKVYTDFGSSTRILLTGDVSPTFGNQGMTVAPGATATHFSRALWFITSSVFSNNPTFVTSLNCLGGFGTGDGVAFVGLGLPTITGSSMTDTGKNFCGFKFNKASGTTTVIAIQCDGGGSVTFSSTLRTLSNGDFLEMFVKMNTSTIDYYTRLNGGALSSATTLSATMPTGAENMISFVVSNKGDSNDFQFQFQAAAYEH